MTSKIICTSSILFCESVKNTSINSTGVFYFLRKYDLTFDYIPQIISDLRQIIMDYYDEQIEVEYSMFKLKYERRRCMFTIKYAGHSLSFVYVNDLRFRQTDVFMPRASDLYKMSGYVCSLLINEKFYYKDMIAFLICYAKRYKLKYESFEKIGDKMMTCHYEDKYVIHNMYTETYENYDYTKKSHERYDVHLVVNNHKVMKIMIIVLNMILKLIRDS